ncbi:MAG: type II toxin-antitoxin system HigB family toxin [Candidatus Obscuribacterales bacterium]|nr:type II toxin-antitoxin system HigB family toxin [Candidatus Obscuribacterales bacterium]
MEIFGAETLTEFATSHTHAEAPLKRWLSFAEKAKWANFAELKETFRSADYYRGAVIFDIGGNKFRLIADIAYEKQAVYIYKVLTHQEYAENKWKKRYENT